MQVKMPPDQTRHWSGLAKKHTTFTIHEHGWQGKVWAASSKIVPICDRQHQIRVYHYILRHRDEGAWVWSALENKDSE
jgi:hypothetical protein